MRSFEARHLAVLSVVLFALMAQALGYTGSLIPTMWSPYPMYMVLLAYLGYPPVVLMLALTGAFVAWCWPMLKGKAPTPLRTHIMLIVVTLLSVVNFVGGWRYGVEYQGVVYSIVCAGVSAALAITAWVLWSRNRKAPSAVRSAFLSFVMFAWLGTYALAYLGEVP